jgi:hypothetical protein
VIEELVHVVAERVEERPLELVGADLDLLPEGSTGVGQLLVAGHDRAPRPVGCRRAGGAT